MADIDVAELALDHSDLAARRAVARLPRHRPGERFLKGPVPFSWLAKAAGLPGCALHVGIALWMEAGIRRSATVPLANTRLKEMGVDRHAKRRALAALEHVALISAVREPGRAPMITILPVDDVGGGKPHKRGEAN
jgi:hypothetical protein